MSVETKVLLVDDEEEILNLYEIILESTLKTKTIRARSGNEAIEILESGEDVDAIVSDYKMDGGTGADLYEFNRNNKDIPFAVVTGFAPQTFKNFENFKEDESKNFLIQKPINEDRLITVIKTMLESKGLDSDIFVEGNELGYKKIKIDHLKSYSSIEADVFIKLSDTKFVRILNSSEDIDESVLSKYQSRGEDYAYLCEEDYNKFYKNTSDNIKKRLTGMKGTSEVFNVSGDVLEHLYVGLQNFGIHKQHIEMVDACVEGCVKKLSADPKLSDLMEIFVNSKGYLITHSLMAMHIAFMIARKLKFSSDITLNKIAYASILHDITLSDPKLSPVLDKNSKEFTALSSKEQEEVINHPFEIAKLIEENEEFPQDTIHLVREHHELPDGSGYPRGLTAQRTGPLSCIFILALKTSHFILHNGFEYEKMQQLKALLKENFDSGNYKKPLAVLLETI